MNMKTVAAFAVSLLLTAASMSNTEAAVSSNLAEGQLCATKLYIAAHGKSPALLMQTAGRLVDFDHVIRVAASINGDTLTPEVRAKYKVGMADFAKNFVTKSCSIHNFF